MVALGDRAVGGDVRVDERDEAVVCLSLFIDEGEDALRACARHDDGIDLLGELVDIARELLGHVEERDENRDIQRLAGKAQVRNADKQQHAAHERQSHIEEVADVADDGAEHAGIGVGAVAVFKEGVVDLVELLDGALLVAEDLDDLLAGHRLLNIALGFGDGLLLAQEEFGAAAADALGDDDHQNHAEHRNERQPDAEIEHNAEHGQHDRARLDEGGDGFGHELAQRVDIVGVEAHDIAVLVGVEVADGKILHAAEHLLTELVEKALRHIGHELLVDQDRDDREHIERDEQRQDGDELCFGGDPVARDVPLFDDLNDILHEKRRDRRDDGREQDARERDGREHRIVGKELFHRALKHGEVRRAVVWAAGILGITLHPAHLRSSGIRRPRGKFHSKRGADRACPCPRYGRCPSRE